MHGSSIKQSTLMHHICSEIYECGHLILAGYDFQHDVQQLSYMIT